MKFPDFKFYLYKCDSSDGVGDEDINSLFSAIGSAVLSWESIECELFELLGFILQCLDVLEHSNLPMEEISEDICGKFKGIKSSIIKHNYGKIPSSTGRIDFLSKTFIPAIFNEKKDSDKEIKYFDDLCSSLKKASWVRNNIAHGKIFKKERFVLTCSDYAHDRKKNPWNFETDTYRAWNNFLKQSGDFYNDNSNYKYDSKIIKLYIDGLLFLSKKIREYRKIFTDAISNASRG